MERLPGSKAGSATTSKTKTRPSPLGQPSPPILGSMSPPPKSLLNLGFSLNPCEVSTFLQGPHRPIGPIPTALCVAHSVQQKGSHWFLICILTGILPSAFLLGRGLPLICGHSPFPGVSHLISRGVPRVIMVSLSFPS